MKINVLVGKNYINYEDGKDDKVLVDMHYGDILIQKQYKKDTQRLMFYPKGTWSRLLFKS